MSSLRRPRLGAALAAAAVLAGAGCRADAALEREVAAPGGAHVARVYVLAGGLGGGFRDRLVFVTPCGAAADPHGGDYAFGVRRGSVTLTWTGPAALTVGYAADGGVFRRRARAGAVALTYAPRPGAASTPSAPSPEPGQPCP